VTRFSTNLNLESTTSHEPPNNHGLQLAVQTLHEHYQISRFWRANYQNCGTVSKITKIRCLFPQVGTQRSKVSRRFGSVSNQNLEVKSEGAGTSRLQARSQQRPDNQSNYVWHTCPPVTTALSSPRTRRLLEAVFLGIN
jgi:hypothetical protein